MSNKCGICSTPFDSELHFDCGGDCLMCMAESSDPDCIKLIRASAEKIAEERDALKAHISSLTKVLMRQPILDSWREIQAWFDRTPEVSLEEREKPLRDKIQTLEQELIALRRWEKTIRENSPLLLLLAQAEKNALFDVQAFLEHMNTLADNARENGFTAHADAVEDMMDELRQWPVSSPWKPIKEAEKEGPARLLYSPDFVSLDFNPEGVIEGAWMNNPDDDDEECWVAAVWNGCHDNWVTKKVEPTHFMMKPVPPNGVNQ